jgi:CubicO group peptidase (beta-lactamase class C family)
MIANLRLLVALLLVAVVPATVRAQADDRPGFPLPPVTAAAPHTTPLSAVGDDALWAGLDAWIEDVMAHWRIPGLAVGAVRDGEVVLARGYGFRDVERRLPVTPQTLMAIGSNSKSFTAALLGMLVDEGRLDWDTPVRHYLPDFQLYDDVATRLMTPRDLVSHRSGLPRHDNLWFGRSYTRRELYDRLRYIEPSATFRQRYQYQNLMFMVAGMLAEQLTGTSWEQLVADRFFAPLGMTRSNTTVRAMPADADHSLPYMIRDDRVVAVPFRNIDAVGPAGSINSSVEEMLRYIQMNIDQGSWRGTQLFSKDVAREMQSPQSATGVVAEYAELGPGAYGLGVSVSGYRGHTLIAHGGGIDGFISSMSWMPGARIGVVVLTNLSGNNPVPTIVMRGVYDRLLGLEPVDWFGRTKAEQEAAERRRQEQERAREAERVAGTSPSHALAAYAGAYEHPAYGRADVALRAGRLVLTIDGLEMPLEHWHYNVFRVGRATDGSDRFRGTRVAFAYGAAGRIDRLQIPLEPAVADIVFSRRAEARAGGSGREP